MDYMNLSRPSNIHAVLRAVWGFEATNGRPPAPGSDSDAAEIFNAACKLIGEEGFGDDEAKAMRILAGAAPGRINPMAAVFGGITAQEVIKAASGKFTPIKQWFMLDAASSIEATPSDCEPRGTRYDGQVAVFGRAFQDALLELKYFLVGSGALGCEFLKNFALMGIGCGESGFVYLTDMDNIEKSNLNRQFLFHEDDVGQMKSTAAAREAKTFNRMCMVVACWGTGPSFYSTVFCVRQRDLTSLLRRTRWPPKPRENTTTSSGCSSMVCAMRWTTWMPACTSTRGVSTSTSRCWSPAPWAPWETT